MCNFVSRHSGKIAVGFLVLGAAAIAGGVTVLTGGVAAPAILVTMSPYIIGLGAGTIVAGTGMGAVHIGQRQEREETEKKMSEAKRQISETEARENRANQQADQSLQSIQILTRQSKESRRKLRKYKRKNNLLTREKNTLMLEKEEILQSKNQVTIFNSSRKKVKQSSSNDGVVAKASGTITEAIPRRK